MYQYIESKCEYYMEKYLQEAPEWVQSFGFKNTELPSLSTGSSSDSGMNDPFGQFNNVQFDSFTNEAPMQHQSIGSPVSLPPMQTSASLQNFTQHSGPSSLEGYSGANPYRAKGRGGGRHGRYYKTASPLFNPSSGTSQTPNNTNTSMPLFNTPPPNNFHQTGVGGSFNNTFMPTTATNMMNQETNVMNISQPTDFDQIKHYEKSCEVDMKVVSKLRRRTHKKAQEKNTKFSPIGKGFNQYPHTDISGEKRRKAEEENDRLRAEKQAKRAENMKRLNQQQEMRIAEQEKEKEALNTQNSFQNDPAPLNHKPRSKEERRNIRDRAKKAREKREEQHGHDAGDLGSLINEISSRGNSICSDIPSEKSMSDSGHFLNNSLNNNSNLSQSSTINSPPETNSFHDPPTHQQTNTIITTSTANDQSFSTASHLFGGTENTNNSVFQQPPPQTTTNNSSPADFFNSKQTHPLNTASHLFSTSRNTSDETTNPAAFFNSQNPQALPGSVPENKQSDNNIFYQSSNTQIPQHVQQQQQQGSEPQSSPETVSYYDQPDVGNVHNQGTIQQRESFQTFVPQESFIQPTVNPIQNNTMQSHDLNQQQYQQQHQQSLEDLVHHPHNEAPSSMGQQYSNDQFVTDNAQQYYQQPQEELRVNTTNNINAPYEHQSGGSSGSGSSYAMVSSTKSTESDSRLSPYQFLDNAQYPAQSSFNSNESSPLDAQNISTASTYEKISAPSTSMSSFDITSGSSAEIRPISLQSSTNVVEAIEEASEAIVEPSSETVEPVYNVVLENKKLLQQKAAALFEEAKQINERASTSSTGSLENQISNFSVPSSSLNDAFGPVQASVSDHNVSALQFSDNTRQQPQQQQQMMPQPQQTEFNISPQPVQFTPTSSSNESLQVTPQLNSSVSQPITMIEPPFQPIAETPDVNQQQLFQPDSMQQPLNSSATFGFEQSNPQSELLQVAQAPSHEQIQQQISLLPEMENGQQEPQQAPKQPTTLQQSQPLTQNSEPQKTAEQNAIDELFGRNSKVPKQPQPVVSAAHLPEPIVEPSPSFVHPAQPVFQPTQRVDYTVSQPLQSVIQPPVQPVAQPVQPVAQPVQPVAQPVQPAFQPVQPVAQPLQPVAQPVQPAFQPVQPVAQPLQPVQPTFQSVQPVTQPVQPVAQPAQPVAQPVQPFAQPVKFVAQPVQPVAQPLQPVAQSVQPAFQPVQPVAQPVQPVAQPVQPVVQPVQPVAQPLQPVAQPLQPVAQSVQPAFQPVQRIAQPAQPVAQPVQSVAQPVKFVAQPVQPVAQSVQPAFQPVQHVAQPVQPVTQPLQPVAQSVQPTFQPVHPVAQPVQPVAQPVQPVSQLPQPFAQPPQAFGHPPQAVQPNTPVYPQQPTTPQTPGLPYQDPMQMMATQQMYSQQSLTPEQVQQYTQYYQQMGYTPEQITQILAQHYGYPGGMAQGYGDMYSSMWLQQQQYMQHMQQMQAYYYGYYTNPYSSYPSSVASSYAGDSRPGSVIERRSSNASDQVLSEIGDLTSELSFQNRTASPHVEEVVQRTTPLSFTRPHLGAAFSMTGGVLNIVAAKQPLDGEIAIVQNIMVENIVGIPLLKRFPGPLLRGDTNKKQISNFIIETIQIYLPRMFANDKNQLVAHSALWEFVGLLVKQNGTFDGSDVADMLINLLPSTEIRNGKEIKGFSTLCNPVVSPREDSLEELQMLMATGRVKDGLDHAVQMQLWGHAFMLGSLMGPKCLGMVQTKFSASMKKSDPMKTLYTHLSNKDAIFIKKRVNVDTWVQNLCMLVSQRTSNPELDGQKIICFGDALRDLGLVAAAHLCYLIANVSFGCHNNADNRIVLLGLEHRPYVDKAANVWADPVNIQLTEIYQYAKTLHDKTFNIPNFQQYKYEYALKLVDYGYMPQSMAYLESIGEAIISDLTYQLFSKEFCISITRHANRMVVQEAEKYEQIDIPEWIQKVEAYSKRARHQLTSSICEANVKIQTPATNISNEALQRSTSRDIPFSPIPYDYSDTSRSNDDSSKDVNGTYESMEPVNPIGQSAPAPYFVPAQNSDVQNEPTWQAYGNENNWEQQVVQDYDQLDGINGQQNFENNENFNNDHMNYDSGASYQNESPRFDPGHYGNQQDQNGDQQDQYGHGQENEEHYNQEQKQQQPEQNETPFTPFYPSNPSNESVDKQSNNAPPPMFYNTPQNNSFNNTFNAPYNDNSQTFNQENQPPQAYKEEEIEEEDLFGGFSTVKSKGESTINKTPEKSKEKPKKEKPSIDGVQSKGWFGGIFSRFKKDKDAYLPEDNDKSIVYDKKLGRWVDKNADPNDEPAPPPPPPMAGFGMETKSLPGNSASLAETPPSSSPFMTPSSDGLMVPPGIPSRPAQPRRSASTLSVMSNASNVSASSHIDDIPPQSQPIVMEEPSAQSMLNRGRMSRKSRLQQNKAAVQKKSEKDKKPVGPPSMFSLKAQGGRRGTARYASVGANNITKNTPMAPVLDPFASPMNAGEKKAGNIVPLSFFNPGAIQPEMDGDGRAA